MLDSFLRQGFEQESSSVYFCRIHEAVTVLGFPTPAYQYWGNAGGGKDGEGSNINKQGAKVVVAYIFVIIPIVFFGVASKLKQADTDLDKGLVVLVCFPD